MGLYGHHKSIDPEGEIVPTSDCCGTVVKLGPGASESGLKEGDRVMSIFVQTHLTGQIVEKDLAVSTFIESRVSLVDVSREQVLLSQRYFSF